MIKPSMLNGVKSMEELESLSDEALNLLISNQKLLIELRPSQVKFESKNISLDVVKCATFTQGYFNRQIIILLHSLGVKVKYFEEKQKETLGFADISKFKELKFQFEKFYKDYSFLQNKSSHEIT